MELNEGVNYELKRLILGTDPPTDYRLSTLDETNNEALVKLFTNKIPLTDLQ